MKIVEKSKLEKLESYHDKYICLCLRKMLMKWRM